uniref:pentatricopeptide repeat-containing protein At4g38150-like n=1 Tax=Erigeron canadensis TaxID=72917 RepID=UPI001CB93681|nr:pentatricopeptide repeat-containing protein At4g38150-like [Erigeron canadensis]
MSRRITSFVFSNLKLLHRHRHRHRLPPLITVPFQPAPIFSRRHFSDQTTTPKRNTKLVNFSLSDSESEPEPEPNSTQTQPNLPPPYNPFNKTQYRQENNDDDPTNLQQVFHKIRTQGLQDNAVKMFDELSKQGLTHEALELFSQIKDKGHMPDVVAHTAVIEAYASAGKPKQALKVHLRMLASGVLPNAYTYTVLIKALGGSGDVKLVSEGKKLVFEMIKKGIRPNAETCVAVFEGIVKFGNVDEGKELVGKMKEAGFDIDVKGVREALKDKRGPVFRGVMDIVFGK